MSEGAGGGIEFRRFIRDVPDFPKPGILFRDVTPLLLAPEALRAAAAAIAAPHLGAGIERVLGVESRGFLFGAPVALELEAGLVPVRKAGKLPAATLGVDYQLEYGSDRLEVHADALRPGQRVLVVDDLLATGGTAAASIALAQRCGAEVVGCAFLIELADLQGRARLSAPVHSVIRY